MKYEMEISAADGSDGTERAVYDPPEGEDPVSHEYVLLDEEGLGSMAYLNIYDGYRYRDRLLLDGLAVQAGFPGLRLGLGHGAVDGVPMAVESRETGGSVFT